MIEQRLAKITNMLTDDKNKLLKQCSSWDKKLSNYYHEVENSSKPDLKRAYNSYMELKNILSNRREVKNDLSVCDSLLAAVRRGKDKSKN
jgi:conjugal transfer/entry exclusion protein